MSNFETFKREQIEGQPEFFDTKLSEIDLPDYRTIDVQGTNLSLGEGGVSGLHDVLGMPRQVSEHFSHVLGDEERVNILRNLRSGLAKKANREVSLAIDPVDHRVVGVSKTKNRVSMEGYFDLFDRFMDRYNLDVQGFASHDGGNSITMRSNMKVDLSRAGLSDEVFKTGVVFKIINGELEFSPFTYRLICTNGMIGRYIENQFSLPELTSRRTVNFFERMDGLARSGFLPENFQEYVERANSTFASVDEVYKARQLVNKYNASEHNMNPNTEKFIDYARVEADYRNFDKTPNIPDMSITQRKSAMTDVKVWDIVNGLTDFASHDYTSDGFHVSPSDSETIQVRAGSLFQKKTLDGENFMPSPYTGGISMN